MLRPGPVVAAGDSPCQSHRCEERSFILRHIHKPPSITGTVVATGLQNTSRALARLVAEGLPGDIWEVGWDGATSNVSPGAPGSGD